MRQPSLFPLVFALRDVLPVVMPVTRSVTADEAIRALATRNPERLYFMGPTWSNAARRGALICQACRGAVVYALAEPLVTCPQCGVARMEVVGSL